MYSAPSYLMLMESIGMDRAVAEYSSSDVTGEMTGHEVSDESESHASSDEMELGLR